MKICKIEDYSDSSCKSFNPKNPDSDIFNHQNQDLLNIEISNAGVVLFRDVYNHLHRDGVRDYDHESNLGGLAALGFR